VLPGNISLVLQRVHIGQVDGYIEQDADTYHVEKYSQSSPNHVDVESQDGTSIRLSQPGWLG
jgi:hypothetical protein